MSQETMKRETDERIPDFYVNSTELSISVYDVQFNFGIRSGTEEAPKEVVIIRMSPQHALAMSKLLLKNLRTYEERVGKINLPQDLLKQLGVEEGSKNDIEV